MNLHPFLRRFIKSVFRRKVFTNKFLAIVVDLRIKLLYSLNSWYYGLFEVYLYSSWIAWINPWKDLLLSITISIYSSIYIL